MACLALGRRLTNYLCPRPRSRPGTTQLVLLLARRQLAVS
jgi:hypothetical protein